MALGFTSLKPEQEEAITQFTLGRDVFVALPTGYGKSLCYYSPVPRPFSYAHAREGKKGLGNNYTLARARGWNLKKVLESLVRAAIQTSARK